MKPQSRFIGSNGTVHLHAKSAVDPHVALIIRPGNPEGDDSFGLDESFQDSRLAVVRILIQDRFDAVQNLAHRLDELPFVRVSGVMMVAIVATGAALARPDPCLRAPGEPSA